MKKIYLLAFSIFMLFTLSACNISDANIKDRVNAPNNNTPPIQGKWEIKRRVDIDNDNDNGNLDIDSYIGQLGLFHKDAVILGEDYATNPSFKLKNVRTYDYLLYKYKVSPNSLGIDQDMIQIISISKDNQYFYEFIKTEDDKLIVYIDDSFYIMEKIVDDVSIDEIDRYINVERSMVRTFETVENEKVKTGVLLGIKIPTYDEEHEVSNWEYKTIWINSQDRNVTDVYEIDNLLVPRKNGFWMLDVERQTLNGDIKDKIRAIPQFTMDNRKVSDEESYNVSRQMTKGLHRSYDNFTLKNILFIGNDYISVEKTEVNKNNKKTLEVYTIDNMEDERPIKLSDIIGEDGKEIFNEGAENILSLDTNAKPNEANMGLDRKNGYWILKGRVNYKQNEEELYKDFNIKAIPPKEMVSYDKLSIPWNMLKSEIPEAMDVYSSPNEELLIVVTHSSLLVFPIINGELIDTNPIRKIALPNNATIIMSEWATGRYPSIWQNEVTKRGRLILE